MNYYLNFFETISSKNNNNFIILNSIKYNIYYVYVIMITFSHKIHYLNKIRGV